MKFISSVYFNLFKNIGNIRLLFVISCFCSVICALVVTTHALDRVKFIDINNISLQETLNAYSPYHELFVDNKLRNYVEIMEDTQAHKQTATKLIVMRKYCLAGMQDEAYEFAQKTLKEVFNGENAIHCPNNKPLQTAYSIEYLWNYLWILFWFYLPFILILPIKFIVDGYKQDNKNKK